MGPFSLKGDIVPNENGALLLDIASDFNLRHVRSHFSCRDSKRWTWRHPRYRTRTVLDHMFLPKPQFRFVCRQLVVPVITVSTDHRLIISELRFRPRVHRNKHAKPIKVNNSSLLDKDIREAFQSEVSNLLGDTDPQELSTAELSKAVRSAPIEAAKQVLPPMVKRKFPPEFSAETINLINQKRDSWRLLQKSGKRVMGSHREAHRKLCQDCKKAIASDRNRVLETEASELAEAFSQDRFKGYKLLKQQHSKSTNAIMPPEAEFTNHYQNHYQPGPEMPLDVSGCELGPSLEDDSLSFAEFESGLKTLNGNRSPGIDDCAPEYIKHGGPKLWQWLYALMFRIWALTDQLPSIDCVGRLIPIPKKTNATSVDSTRPICLLTTIYKI